MYGIYPVMGMMNGMYGQQGNVHQNLKNKYGIGPSDFTDKPYFQGYPMAILPCNKPNIRKSFVEKMVNKIFA